MIFRSICCSPARLHLIDCIFLLPNGRLTTESHFLPLLLALWGEKNMSDRGSDWCPKRGKRRFFWNTHRRQQTKGTAWKQCGKGSRSNQRQEGPFADENLSSENWEITADGPLPLDLCPLSPPKKEKLIACRLYHVKPAALAITCSSGSALP